MAVIRYDEEYVNTVLGDISLLPDLGVQVEKVDDEYEFEITPDRPDLLSIYGLKRLLEVYMTKKPRKYKLETDNPIGEIKVDPSVKEIRPFIVSAVVKGVNINEHDLKDIMQLQEKMHFTYGRKRRKVAIGIHDLSAVSFPMKYYADDLDNVRFIPLEENREMTAREILETTDKGKDYAHLVPTGMGRGVFVADDKGIISFPPIINADRTKLKPGKTDVFIEMTGTSERALSNALNIVVTTLAEMGGKIYPIKVGEKIYPKLTYKEHNIPREYIKTFVGKELKDAEIKQLLNSMDWVVKDGKVYSQPYRTDVIGPVDIAEDILIAYGYNNVTPEFPALPTIGYRKSEHVFHKILTGLGFLEVMTWTMTNEDKLKKANVNVPELIKIVNPLSEEFTVFRPVLLPGLLEVLRESKKVSMPHKIYELGVVAPPEREVLGIAMCYPGATFSHIRSVVQSLITETAKEKDITIVKHKDDRFIPGRCAGIKFNDKIIGVFGEVHPEIIERFEIEQPVLYLETELWVR